MVTREIGRLEFGHPEEAERGLVASRLFEKPRLLKPSSSKVVGARVPPIRARESCRNGTDISMHVRFLCRVPNSMAASASARRSATGTPAGKPLMDNELRLNAA